MKTSSLYRTISNWWKALSLDEQIDYLTSFRIGFSYNSGVIENESITYHDTREVFLENGITAYTGDLRTLFEISNAKVAWEMVAEHLLDESEVTEQEILDLQEALTHGTYDTVRWNKGERPGTYKIGEYGVGEKAEVGCAAKDAQNLMRQLVTNINEYIAEGMSEGDEFVLAAYAHAALVDIHPFSDGNGRTARLLMNRILLSFGAPPITFHQEDKFAYYEALDAYHKDDNLEPFQNFALVQLVKTWEERDLQQEIDLPTQGSNLHL